MRKETLLSRREIPIAPSGEKTYGLRVFREVHGFESQEQIHWTYDLPDGVVVLPVTEDKKVIAIKKFRPGVGEYPQIPAESMSNGEMLRYRSAMDSGDHVRASATVLQIAARCLSEETGYKPGRIKILTTLSQHSGKTRMVHVFCLAEDCKKFGDGGTDKEEGIMLLKPSDTGEIWRMLTDYVSDDPVSPHGGKNSLIAAALSFHQLGALRVESIPEFKGEPIVVAFRGLPLSGKTTLATAVAKKLGWHFMDVDVMRDAAVGRPNRDEVPNPWLNEETARREREDMRLAYTAMHDGVRAAINLGRSVIVAATYSKVPAQNFLREIVEAHPGARLVGVKCVFDDTEEEVRRRLQGERGRGGCLTPEHYFSDRKNYDHADLWGVTEVNTSRPLEECVEEVVRLIESN